MIKKVLALVVFISAFTVTAFAQHHVVLKNGEKIECVVISLNNDTLEIYVDLNMKKIHLKEVSSIYFDQHVEYDGSMDDSEEYKEVTSGEYTIKYKMVDRTIEKAPPMSNATEKKGRVVVKVTIDRYGIVKKTETGYVGSTTTDKYLLVKAMKAAQATRFNQKLKGPITQEGTMVFEY